ncbi:MAG TPA: VRR-NUC domain-containing protein [Burkholderiaceae bacterium]
MNNSPREREVEALLVKRVQAAGGQAYKFTSPGRVGVPDRIVLLPWREPVFVEVKRKGMVPRPSQVREHQRMRAAGATVVVIDDAAGISALLEERE